MSIRRAQKQKDADSKRRSEPAPAASVTKLKPNDGINSAEAAVEDARADKSSTPNDLPEELIAARAYEKWRLRGCPMGHDSEQDWHAAREELEAERRGWAAPQAGDDRRSADK